jgi:hypothetical protein
MAILGGSPLGLINVTSRPTKTGKTTFGSGQKEKESGNVNDYNISGKYTPPDSDQADDSTPSKFSGNKSIFSGNRSFKPWPSISRDQLEPKKYANAKELVDDESVSPEDDVDLAKPSRFHSNSLYDTSVLNIIQQLSGTKAALKPADFAYLKDIGVYPNNRLMIARRMSNPAASVPNLMRKGAPPLATLISWVPTDKDFIVVDFGENWVAAEADFTGVLNDLGGDISKASGSLGGNVGQLLQAVPLPGFTEIIQRKVLSSLKIFDEDSGFVPAGEPNLIKEAKQRAVVAPTSPGSGLKGTFTIAMSCEWEQKFISGLDPTLVWMDIISMVLRFGTSNSKTYGLSAGFGSKMIKYANNPSLLIDATIAAVTSAINEAKETIKKLLSQAADALSPKGKEEEKTKTPDEIKKEKDAADKANADGQSLAASAGDKLITLAKKILSGAIGKYRERIVGIINSLSGMPSTPWHITIGNPMRPVFVSGDMLTTDVKLTLGSTLAFNDLPSSIKVEFSLVPARNLGLQELFAKFNAGHLRTVTFEDPVGKERTGKLKSGKVERANANPVEGPQLENKDTTDAAGKTTGDAKKPAEVNTTAGTSDVSAPSGLTVSTAPAGLTVSTAPAGLTVSTAEAASTSGPVISSTGTTDATKLGGNLDVINSDANSLSSTKPLDILT